ncbi:MAG: S41 family peptidase, partial [Chloroflexota bacterium]
RPVDGNLASSMWLGEPGSLGRIYFIADHEGVGNLYSCLPDGSDVRRHTQHDRYYVRNAATDGRRIVYHAGGELYLYDPAADSSAQIKVQYYSPRIQRHRKFVNGYDFLESWCLHPTGHSTTATVRGKLFSFPNWEGAVSSYYLGEPDPSENEPYTGVRFRMPHYLADGQHIIAVTDSPGEETFIVFPTNPLEGAPTLFSGLDIGRPQELAVNWHKDQVVFSNHRYELLFLDLETRELKLIDRGKANAPNGFCWSPDGEWVAYSVSTTLETSVIRLWHAADNTVTPVTRRVLRDVAPAFDPHGRYLYFISYRTFNPVYDSLHFELSFPRGARPYLVTLQKDSPSPFAPNPQTNAPEQGRDDDEKKSTPGRGRAVRLAPVERILPGEVLDQDPDDPAAQLAPAEVFEPQAAQAEDASKPPERPLMKIDLEGIEERVVAFPAPEGLYGRIAGLRSDRVIYSRYPIEGALAPAPNDGTGTLFSFNLEDRREELLANGINDFRLSLDSRTLIYRSGNRLRVLKSGEKAPVENFPPNRRTGWLDLARLKAAVQPGAEWRQMYREAWRLQRDQFWQEDMLPANWLEVYDRYLPLVDRVGSRAEFSDLMWEMQGELGTSHAYEYGGDYRPEPRYLQGRLGAEFDWSQENSGWRIRKIHRGDAWDREASSPLVQPGLRIEAGDTLMAINGTKLTEGFTPAMALVNHAAEEVTLVVLPAGEYASSQDKFRALRSVSVRTLVSENRLRYREWVDANRRYVQEKSGGRLGYVHIPDMGPNGYAEFHRGFLAEVDRDGLIVDVRFNQGGSVSSLILEKLARRRVAYINSRWMQVPEPYPQYAIAGPMVALTNEYAGSDGDIFSHTFKLMGLGPLIGKRTWGGVIGITPNLRQVDGTIITQPEHAFWFSDVGWGIENYGTEPDIEVDNRPQDFARGLDPQLDRAITEALRMLEANPPALPEFLQERRGGEPKLSPES